jgi:hypothetical protein
MGTIKPYQAYLVKIVLLDLLPLWYLQALRMPTFVVCIKEYTCPYCLIT